MKGDIKKHVGQKIRNFRKIQKLTQKELGEKVGVKHNTISSYESGMNEPEQDILYNLANVLNVSINDFFPSKDKENDTTDLIKNNEYNFIPTAISAGIPIEVDSILESDVKKIKIPDSLMGKWAGNKDICITKISGESMNNIIPDGSVIAVKKTEISCLKDGDIVVFSDEYEYSVKRFFTKNDKLIFRPDSTSKEFYDHVTNNSNENLTIYGKVVLYLVEL